MRLSLALVAAVGILSACGRGPVSAGQRFPELTFSSLAGQPAILKPAPGRITVVNVFATWCPPCKAETPDLVAFAKAAGSKGVDVIGIDQQESPVQVSAFAQRYGIAYPLMIDAGRQTKDVLGAHIIPRTIVIDGSGVVRAVVSGPMTAAQMRAAAAAAGAALYDLPAARSTPRASASA